MVATIEMASGLHFTPYPRSKELKGAFTKWRMMEGVSDLLCLVNALVRRAQERSMGSSPSGRVTLLVGMADTRASMARDLRGRGNSPSSNQTD